MCSRAVQQSRGSTPSALQSVIKRFSVQIRHLMAPLVPALAQSESKARFFARLGLNPADPVHKRVYVLMKMEAAEARRRLMQSQSSSTAQIHEITWQREVMRIYDAARTETKAVYQFGHDTTDREIPDNWIIRWLLWHVFRYRDYRNKGRPVALTPTTSVSTSSDDGGSVGGSPVLALPDPRDNPEPNAGARARSTSTASVSASSATQYWDPIREQWQR